MLGRYQTQHLKMSGAKPKIILSWLHDSIIFYPFLYIYNHVQVYIYIYNMYMYIYIYNMYMYRCIYIICICIYIYIICICIIYIVFKYTYISRYCRRIGVPSHLFDKWSEDHEIGDGTTGVVVMAGALLEKAQHFTDGHRVMGVMAQG